MKNANETLFPGPSDTVMVDPEERLEELFAAKQAEEQFQTVKARTEGYVPSTTVDELGVARESVKYAVAKCRTCYGRGWKAEVVRPIYYRNDKNMVNVLAPVIAKSGNLQGSRYYTACECQEKGYVKARRKAEEAAIALENQVKKATEAAYEKTE